MLLYGSNPEDHSRFSKNVLSIMRNDDITFVVKRDPAILNHGAFLFSNASSGKKSYISQKIRMLGRLLIKLRKQSENLRLSDCLRPGFFNKIVEATKNICQFEMGKDECSPEFKIPSTALKRGML